MTKRTRLAASPARGGSYAKGDARREEILRGVTDFIARDGYRRQSLRKIGKALDVDPAHILYYFASRDHLLQSVIELWDYDAMSALTGEREVQSSLDLFVAAVRRNCDAPGIGHLFLSFATDAIDPGHVAHDFFRTRADILHRSLGDAVRREQERGTIPVGIDPMLAGRNLMALANGLQMQSLIGSGYSAVDDLAAAVRELRSIGSSSKDGI